MEDTFTSVVSGMCSHSLELKILRLLVLRARVPKVKEAIEGVPVDSLSNKTLIQEYYANDFTKFVDVLVKNKSRIKEGYNPKSRAHHDILKDWYDSSVAKLKPLMAKIDATDGLIDQIVYKLYGLTDDEIKVVEGTPA